MDSKLVGINQMKLLIQCHILFLRSRNGIYTIFIRKTNLKLDLLNFNIERSEYEKIDIFLNQLNFVLFKKPFKTIHNKKCKNRVA